MIKTCATCGADAPGCLSKLRAELCRLWEPPRTLHAIASEHGITFDTQPDTQPAPLVEAYEYPYPGSLREFCAQGIMAEPGAGRLATIAKERAACPDFSAELREWCENADELLSIALAQAARLKAADEFAEACEDIDRTDCPSGCKYQDCANDSEMPCKLQERRDDALAAYREGAR